MEARGSKFTWTITNFSTLNTNKHYSEVFLFADYEWRLLIFPKGNNVDQLSFFLDALGLDYGSRRFAEFSLSVVNQISNQDTVRQETQHNFGPTERDWGFTSFMPLHDLHGLDKGFLVNDTLIVEVGFIQPEVPVNNDLETEIGYVGLENQGATSYINSLVQTLYHIPCFRKAVYQIPAVENDVPSRSITLALQRLFYKLQFSKESVTTKELTKSFGWDVDDLQNTRDVQELNRILCEKLEEKMKGSVVEGTIQKLFEGHHMNYLECIDVNCKTKIKESFYDLQLDVKGCRDVYASFDKYVDVERLEGDNKYHTAEHGLQDAKKSALFTDFPPILHLQLKRFEYDSARDIMVKINDRYEFPLELDLDKENGKYLSPDADREVRNLFMLHSILAHSGGEHGGRCYAFIRPTLSDQWFKFDDARVTKEAMNKALEELYGGEEQQLSQMHTDDTPFTLTKDSNAYMLVYIRKSDMDSIICDVDEQDIAEPLRVTLKNEEEKAIKVVYFRSLLEPKVDAFSLSLSMLLGYDEVVESVASHLKIDDPLRIRLKSHNSISHQPEPTPIKFMRGMDHLSDMLVHCNQKSDILYYEVLDTPMAVDANDGTQQSRPSTCVICLDAPLEGACLPCGHMAGCMTCLNVIKVQELGCPVCRANIQEVVRIYIV